MPTLDQIRTKIAEKIFAVAPTIAVHDYERYTKNMSDLAAMYKSEDVLDANAARLNGYHVRRVATAEDEPMVGAKKEVTHTWEIRGFMALDDADATEKLFDNQVEAIRDTFREDDTLGGLVATTVVGNAAGVQVLESVPVVFAGVLSHSAKLRLFTRHYQ
ncbi:MAG: hypothetical protein M0015_02930 [Betaproteobacteria bacterium]|nr:hypothetical protein [Betaproteobacteria bacterium]